MTPVKARGADGAARRAPRAPAARVGSRGIAPRRRPAIRASALLALLLAPCFAAPAAAGDEPVVEASDEAKALVARAAALLHGPAALAKESLDVPLRAVVGGKRGEAAVAVDLRLRLDPGGRNLRCDGPTEGNGARIAGLAWLPFHATVEPLLGGILPYPWDSWKGSVDDEGAVRAELKGEDGRPYGMEVTFDGRGLPVSSWSLLPGKDGALRRRAFSEYAWGQAGKRFRLVRAVQTDGDHVVLESAFEWGPPEELLPRRWTVVVEDRVTRFSREGHAAPVPPLGPSMVYALDPRPREFLDDLKARGDALLAPTDPKKPDHGDLLSVALAAVLRSDPTAIDSVIEDLAAAGPGPGRVLVRAVARAADADLGRSLDAIRPLLYESVRGECDLVRDGLPRPLESPVPMDDVIRGSAALDRCWALYLVSGDPAALRPIVGALRGLDDMDRKDASGRKVVTTGLLVGGAARWSLVSNARQLPGVRECLERDLGIVPAALRPHLEDVLKRSDPSKAPPDAGKEPPEGR